MKRSTLIAALLVPAVLSAQTSKYPLKYVAKPTVPAITAGDLMSRLYPFADDSMNGRSAGTREHDKGTDYIARELARLKLQPAGDNGTYFQRIPLADHAIADDVTITVDGRTFKTGVDFLVRDPSVFGATAREMNDAPAIYGGVFGDTASMIKPMEAQGKVVIFTVPQGWQANRQALIGYYLQAQAIVVATLDAMTPDVKEGLSGPTQLMTNNPLLMPVPAFFYSSTAMAEAMLGAPLAGLKPGTAGKTVTGTMRYTDTPSAGARNVIAILPGSDAKLKGQYVAIGAHSDHVKPGDGGAGVDYDTPIDHDSVYAFHHVVRPGGLDDGDKQAKPEDWPKINRMIDSLRKVHTPRLDSIWNGADDDGSGSMGLLEVAEAFANDRVKPRRSILFIWHVGEELGLYGSEFFTDHPTVPRDSITAEINIDMIGRGSAQDIPGGGPQYIQMIGSRRLSTELGDLMDAEAKKLNFTFDYQFDANGHPQQFYCRSDHYNYARYGIPIAFMSTGGHPEYHEVTDEPQYIDYDKLARVSQLVYNSARTIANRDARLVVDKPKPDPKGECRQ